MEFLIEYGLFLAKTLTLVVSVLVFVAMVIGMSQRSRNTDRGHIEVRSLNDNIEGITNNLRQMVLDGQTYKQEVKARKKAEKEEKKARKHARESLARKPRVYVVDFNGDIAANEVKQLREEVTAILSVAEPMDEVVVRLESPGGQVHGYGLAASQLKRIVSKGIPLTVAVDKVAASGGYMMACIGTRIIAAPFALLGSIGVVAQLPNFHRLLKKNDVDVEILTAGEYKRTLTIFGENTERGREKFQAELEDVHALFKEFVSENRPAVNINEVATGEAWYGRRALSHQLVDELKTSDEYLYDRCQQADVYQVRFVDDKNRIDKVIDRMTYAIRRLSGREDLDTHKPYMF
ncbi:MAG: protease SohB [Pseudomonadota bacterium]